MKKTIYGIFLTLILLLNVSMLLFSVKLVEGTTITVPNDYTSIQKAINAASSGDTVFVKEGVYFEHIVVNKTISLVGENKTLTVIDGNRTGTVVLVTAPSVTLSGFTIRNSGSTMSDCGIKLSPPLRGPPSLLIQRANITDNIIANNTCGIDLYSSSNNTVSGNVFTNDGLFVDEAYTIYPSFHNIVRDNFVNGKPLVYLENASGQVVRDAGQVVFVNCRSMVVGNVTLSNAGISIELYHTSSTGITSSNITNNKDYGVFFLKSLNDVVSGNSITNNGYGIGLDSSSGNTIIRNNVTNSVKTGILLSSSSGNSIGADNITNSQNGISADGSSENETITHDNFLRDPNAISLQGSLTVVNGSILSWSNSFHSIIGNRFLNDSQSAISVEGGRNSISTNNILRCGEGITISGSNNSVTENVISNCSLQGIGPGIGVSSYFENEFAGLLGHSYYAGNLVSGCSSGLQIVGGGNVLRNNTLFDNGVNFEVGWLDLVPAAPDLPTATLLPFIQDIDPSNTVNGKPIYYLVNRQNMTVPPDAGYVEVVNSTKVVLEDSNMSSGYHGLAGLDVRIVYAFTNDSAIQNVSAQGFAIVACNNIAINNNDASEFDLSRCTNATADRNSGAWVLWETNSSTVTNNHGNSITTEFSINNHIVSNMNTSIILMDSNGSVIENNHGGSIEIEMNTQPVPGATNPYTMFASKNNTVANNAVSGISILYSCNNAICNNSITCPNSGDEWYYTDGISLLWAHNNTINYNKITDAARGITAEEAGYSLSPASTTTTNNTFLGNVIANGTIGIAECGSNNLFKDNSLLNNRYDVGSAWLTYNHVDTSNTVNGKPIYHFTNQSNLTIDPSTYPNIGYLALTNCTNSIIRNLTLTNNCEGLTLSNARNVTVTNCEMQEDIIGLSISGSLNSITNNTISNNLYGLSLINSESVQNTISRNTITNNTYRNFAPQDTSWLAIIGLPYYIWDAVDLAGSFDGVSGGCFIAGYNNIIVSNSINDNARGFTLYGGGNTFRNNTLDGNIYNIALLADSSWSFATFNQDMDSSNLVDGKPVYYLVNQHNQEVPANAGFVLLLNSTGITVKNLNITHNRYGIVLVDTSNTTITNANVTSCLIGIYVTQPPSIASGITFASTNNTIANCTLTNNCAGIGMYPGNLTLIRENTISNNQVGIWIGPKSNNNTVLENTVINNSISRFSPPLNLSQPWSYPFPEQDSIPPIFSWIDLGSVILESSYNTVAENTIAYNDYGLSVGAPNLGSPGGNLIYHNNFINNTYFQVSVGSQNSWNIGYPGGGNYFSDYKGTDNYSGPNQNQPGCDGIGDTPYPLYHYRSFGYGYKGWAYYPLMAPWTPGPMRTFILNISNTLYKVVFNTNSTITNLQLNRTDPTQPELVFNATGTLGTTGYLNVTLPKLLLNATNKNSWMILVDGKLVNGTITENDTCTFISIAYQYHSPVKIEIRGTSAVPENLTPMLTILIALIALINALLAKKKRRKLVNRPRRWLIKAVQIAHVRLREFSSVLSRLIAFSLK